MVAAVAIVVVAAEVNVVADIKLGLLVAIMLGPVWLPSARRFQGATALGGLTLLALAAGLWLSMYSVSNHAVIGRERLLDGAVILSLVTGTGMLLWCRTVWQDWQVGLFFGLGMFLSIRPNAGFEENAWRFGFSAPVIVTVLALAASRQRRWVELAACLALGLVSALAGGRSRTAVLLMVAVLVLWQVWRPSRRTGAAAVRAAVVLSVIAVAMYQFGQAVILEGYLGEDARQRTELQIQQSGSLILGGRPEMAASAALMRDSPAGFGLGVVPNMHDLSVAKSGLAGINYDPNNGYVERFMFGNGFELHSSVGDLWSWTGAPGLALGLAIVVAVVWRMAVLVARRRASALAMFAALTMLWNSMFSPLQTSVPVLLLCLGLMLKARPQGLPQAGSPSAVSSGMGLSRRCEIPENRMPGRQTVGRAWQRRTD